MKSRDEIAHDGKIVEITPEFTSVEIIASSACSSCHAKGMCGVSEEERKVIMLPTDPYASWEEGDNVRVFMKKSMGLKAVWHPFGGFNDFNIIFVARYRQRASEGTCCHSRSGCVLSVCLALQGQACG